MFKTNKIKCIVFSLCLLLLQIFAVAQESTHTVKGRVSDENNQALPGVGVVVSGTLHGVISDEYGNYSINVAPDAELQFSYLGFKTETLKVGGRTLINVTMKSDAQVMESAVVTALGIKRDEKSLGYAAQKIGEEAFANVSTSSNWLSGLTGQVAGLNIVQANSGPGGSVRVTLRGESSADLSNNTALFVVDGVPMFNTATSSDIDGSVYAVDYGNGTADVNPDDIESITVLKGPAATALYGSSAANGAIIITTKSANSLQSKLSVTFSSTLTLESVNTSPDLQYVYGQGENSDYYYYLDGNDSGKGAGYHPMQGWTNQSVLRSWGPKMDGTLYYQYYNPEKGIGGQLDADGNFVREATPFVSHGDWFKDFFETGYAWANTLTVSGKINRNNNIRVSFTDVRNTGVVPNSPTNTQKISVRAKNEFTDWFTSELSLNYRRNFYDNLPVSSGYGSTSIMYSLWCYAPNVDMDWARNYWVKEGEVQNRNLSGAKNNAYFIANECVNTQDRNKLYGNLKFDFRLYKGLTLMVRAGVDTENDFRTQRQATSTQARPDGWYREQNVASSQYSGEFLLRYDRKLPEDFRITANLGGSILYRNYRKIVQTADNLVVPSVYTLANAGSEVKTDNYAWERQTNSLYGLVQLSWRNALFLDVTGRNDWSSTLPASNRSYFYPSVSGSAVLNELLGFGGAGDVINMLKLRTSWAQVGHDTSPYRIEDYLATTGIPGSVTIPSSKVNGTLKPEMVSSWEAGLDLRMLRNRLSFDLAYYDSVSSNILSSMPVSTSTGMSSLITNAGEIRNRGVEISVNGTLLRFNDMEWKVFANWSLNRNKVLKLGDGIDFWQIAGYNTYAYMYAAVGDSMTSMYGRKFKRAPEGSYAVDASGKLTDVSGRLILNEQGFPVVDTDIEYIGETMPDWKGGFGTSFTWKGLKCSISFDGQHGGHVWSMTNWVLNSRGKGLATLEGREGGFVPDGVVALSDGNYRVYTDAIPKESMPAYYETLYDRNCTESNFVSTQYLRLREARLEYSLPKKLLTRTRFINSLSVAVFGNNLYTWSSFPGFDPTAVAMRGHALSPGFDFLQMPGTAQYGFSIKLVY